MKNLKINQSTINKIYCVGVAITLCTTGGLLIGKSININDTKKIQEYENTIFELQEEIEVLSEKKEYLENSKTFNISNLIVIEHKNIDGESNLHILTSSGETGICHEYHNNFDAWYYLHDPEDEHTHSACSKYIHFYESTPLFDYLTEEEVSEITKNGGKVTTIELDKILERIRVEYKDQLKNSNITK